MAAAAAHCLRIFPPWKRDRVAFAACREEEEDDDDNSDDGSITNHHHTNGGNLLSSPTYQPSNHPILPGIFHSALVVAFVAAVDDVAKEREQIL